MEQRSLSSKAQYTETEEIICTQHYPQEVSSFVVVSSVGVRGLDESISTLPLVVELIVSGRSYVTNTLMPLASAEKKHTDQEGNSQEKKEQEPCRRGTKGGSILGLEPLRIILPIEATRRKSIIRQTAAGPHFVNGGEAASLSQGGVHVALRTVGSSTPLGTAVCYYPGDWFPLSTCGGEVQVQFKVCFQNDSSIRSSRIQVQREVFGQEYSYHNGMEGPMIFSQPKHSSINSLSGEMEDCNKHSCSFSGAARQAHSANVTPKGSLKTRKNKISSTSLFGNDCPNGPSCCFSNTSYDLPHLSVMSSNDASLMHSHSPQSGRPSTGDYNNAALYSEKKCNPQHARMRECQPRSLVFSDIRVKGFTPLSSHGNWRLVFSWPHPKLSLRKRILWIPLEVDEAGAAVLEDTISIDLPLFMRGEMQTCVCAVWTGDSGEGMRTHVEVQVEFDPFVVLVQESEGCWKEERHHKLALADRMPMHIPELSIQVVVKLQFYEPQRDGRNGRPTSAFPRRRSKPSADSEEEYHNNNNNNNNNNNHNSSSNNNSKSNNNNNNNNNNSSRSGSSRRRNSGDTKTPVRTETLTRNPQSGLKQKQKQQEQQQQPPLRQQQLLDQQQQQYHRQRQLSELLQKQQQERQKQLSELLKQQQRQLQELQRKQQEYTHRSPSPFLRQQDTGLFPNIQDLVPCYTEQRRHSVFKAYDKAHRGYITREQLLHFCRAHVALFSSEQSDLSILRRVYPYVPGLARRSSGLFTSPAVQTQRNSLKEGETTMDEGNTQPKETTKRKSSSFGLSAEEPMAAAATATAATTEIVKKLPESDSEGIPYGVFEIIALRLASM